MPERMVGRKRVIVSPKFAQVKALVVLALVTWAVSPAAAQHPYLFLDTTELDFIRSKVAANSADWQGLRTQCDLLTKYSVQWPHATNGGSSLTRGYVYKPAGAANSIYQGYYGGGWDTAINQLGACYQAIRVTDPVRAAGYLAQAHNIITSMAQPWIKMVRASDGQVRYGVSTDAAGNDLMAGAQVQVLLTNNTGATGPAVGETWTLSGATGCTSMNGTFTVSGKQGSWSVLFSQTDQSRALLNANCTLYSVSVVDGYPVRFYMPAIAKAYDWFYDGLSQSYPADLTNLAAAMSAWATELGFITAFSHPESNYHTGFIWGAVACYIAFDLDFSADIGPACSNAISQNFLATHQFRDYNNQWLAGGGNGEGLQAYGYAAIRHILEAELAMKVYGVDWSVPPYNFTFLDDNLQYLMEFASPTLLALDDNEYVYSVGTSYCGGNACGARWYPTEATYIPLSDLTFYTAVANRLNSAHAAQFQSWVQSVYSAQVAAAGKTIPAWALGSKPYSTAPTLQDAFLWNDSTRPSSDWTRMPLMYRAWGGNYAVTRSSWGVTATEVTLLGGPSVGAAGNGKTQFDSGAVTIQAGNNRLLVFGLGEAARSADIISSTSFGYLDGERQSYGNQKNSIWWAAASLSQTNNQGLISKTNPPGQTYTVTTWPSSIDLAEDNAKYTYFRANHLEANGAKSSVDQLWHQVAWTRELFFLRPNLVIIHDRTTSLNAEDYQKMIWDFGRTPQRVENGVPQGMTRFDVTDPHGVFHGTFWSVLPLGASVNLVNHSNPHVNSGAPLNFLYRAEVIPPLQAQNNWLAVFDTSASLYLIHTVSSISATNADAVQFNDASSSIVAFVNVDPHIVAGTILAWPVFNSRAQYIIGLTPGAYYEIVSSGGTLRLSSTGPYQASAAGVLVYSNSCGTLVPPATTWPRRWIAFPCTSDFPLN